MMASVPCQEAMSWSEAIVSVAFFVAGAVIVYAFFKYVIGPL